MIEANGKATAEQYRREGVAKDVLRASGVDFTGDRLNDDGQLVAEAASDAVLRMTELIRTANPDGIRLLQDAGIEVY